MDFLENMNFTGFTDVSAVLMFIGAMAFLVSTIAEITKMFKWFDSHVPTALTVMVLSLVLCPVTLFALFDWMNQPITWYLVFASFIAAFIVALVSMEGWDKVTELANRMFHKKE